MTKQVTAMIRTLAIWPPDIALSMLAQSTVTPETSVDTSGHPAEMPGENRRQFRMRVSLSSRELSR